MVDDADADATNELQDWSNLPGIPANIDITKTKSLGMKIFHKLVQQIDGTLQSDFSNGTKFTITF